MTAGRNRALMTFAAASVLGGLVTLTAGSRSMHPGETQESKPMITADRRTEAGPVGRVGPVGQVGPAGGAGGRPIPPLDAAAPRVVRTATFALG